jgi:hypothetical protein
MFSTNIVASKEKLIDFYTGQIKPGTAFGGMLTWLALQSETIVETGTWHGLGSTLCLVLGMVRPTQRLYTIELSSQACAEAATYYDDNRITFINGTLITESEWPEFNYPDPSYRHFWEAERAINKTVPYVLDQLPSSIDLLVIDAGIWSGRAEFLRLWERSRIIAMDDTNGSRTSKNELNRQQLLDAHWTIVADMPNDRTGGWSVFQRPSS